MTSGAGSGRGGVRGRAQRIGIVLLLAGAFAAEGQEETRRKLREPANIDGVSCAPTRRTYAEFHLSGRLESCPLANDTTIGGHRLFAGTWVILDASGLLRAAWLVRDTELAGHLCKGTGYKGYSVRFREDESLELCFLPRDIEIDGVPCLRGSFLTEVRGGGRTAATFHPDGSLAGCQLSRDFIRDGVRLHKWDRITLDRWGAAGSPRRPLPNPG